MARLVQYRRQKAGDTLDNLPQAYTLESPTQETQQTGESGYEGSVVYFPEEHI